MIVESKSKGQYKWKTENYYLLIEFYELTKNDLNLKPQTSLEIHYCGKKAGLNHEAIQIYPGSNS